MKKIILKFITVILLISVLSACDNSNDTIPKETDSSGAKMKTIKIASLKDVSATGLLKLAEDSQGSLYNDVKYEIVFFDTPEELLNNFKKDEFNIANLPCNLAVDLYGHSDGGASIAAITSTVNYVVIERNNEINYFEELRRSKIAVFDPGKTVDWILPFLLKGHFIDIKYDVDVSFLDSYESVLNVMMYDDQAFGIVPFHLAFDAVREIQNSDFAIAYQLQGAWANIDPETTYVSDVVLVKNSYRDKNTEEFETFLTRSFDSVKYISHPNNIDDSSDLIEKYGIMNKNLAKESIRFNGISFTVGEEMKDTVSSYLNVLYEFDPELFNGDVPKDDFYYFTTTVKP